MSDLLGWFLSLALSPVVFFISLSLEFVVLIAYFYSMLSRPVYAVRWTAVPRALRNVVVVTLTVTFLESLDRGLEKFVFPFIILYLAFCLARLLSAIYTLPDITSVTTVYDVVLKHKSISSMLTHFGTFKLVWGQVREIRKDARYLWRKLIFSERSVYAKLLRAVDLDPSILNQHNLLLLEIKELVSRVLEKVEAGDLLDLDRMSRDILNSLTSPGVPYDETAHHLVVRELLGWALFGTLVFYVCEYVSYRLQRLYISLSKRSLGMGGHGFRARSVLGESGDSGASPDFVPGE